MKRLIILCYLIAITYSNAFSQESINKDVKVVSSYTPIVSEATKISLLPQMDDTTSVKPTFDYKISSKKLETEFITQPIAPAKLAKQQVFYAPKTLVKLGGGNYSTLFGELYYNILKSEKYAVGLNAEQFGTYGKVKLSNDSLVKAPLSITKAGIDVRRFYKQGTLTFDLNFNRTAIAYYGLQTFTPLKDYYLKEGSNIPTSGANLIESSSQRHSVFDASIGYFKSGGDEKDDSYNAKFNFASYSNKTGVNENSVVIDGGYKHYIEAFYLEVLGNIEADYLKTPSNTTPLYQFSASDRTTLSIMPRIGFIFSHADIQVGLNFYSQAGTFVDRNLYVGPHLLGKLNLAEGIITVFGGATSNLNINNYRNTAYDNYFISPDLNLKSSWYGIDLFGGVKGNFSSKTSFMARADYSSFSDEHFFVNKSFGYTDPTDPLVKPAFDYSNQFGVDYNNGELLTVSGEFMVKPNELFDIVLNGKYYNWDLSTQQIQAWYKPNFEIGIKSIFKPYEGWKITAELLTIGERLAFDVTTLNSKKLKPNYDISLGAEYHYNQNWMFFGGIYNMIGSKYYQWNEYPMQGINCRIGAGYTF